MWTERIELIYRVFVRTNSDIRGRFSNIKTGLSSLPIKENLLFSEPEEIFWPCNPSEVDTLSERGFLVTRYNDKPHVIIREQKIIIHVPNTMTSNEVLGLIDKEFDENTFVSTKIVSERLIDLQAL